MDVMKSSGESSSKGQEDGDATTGSERPLKKARFAWQVKGKYNLRNETDEPNKNLTGVSVEPSTDKSIPTSQGPSNALQSSIENNISSQNTKLDSVETSDSSLLYTPIYDLSTEQSLYPRYVSSFERNNNGMERSNGVKSFIPTISIDMNMKYEDAENLCIAQWQEDQILTSCLDNTINQVLDSRTHDMEVNDRDFTEYFNHWVPDNSVENEGILMAISAHGLQNTSSSNSNGSSIIENCSQSTTHVSDIYSPLRCISPVTEINKSHRSQIDKVQQSETGNKLPIEGNMLSDWQSDSQNASDSSFAYFSNPPQSTYFYNDNIQSSNTDSFEMDSNFDFMNAAVLFAIQSKGLTASCTEYG